MTRRNEPLAHPESNTASGRKRGRKPGNKNILPSDKDIRLNASDVLHILSLTVESYVRAASERSGRAWDIEKIDSLLCEVSRFFHDNRVPDEFRAKVCLLCEHQLGMLAKEHGYVFGRTGVQVKKTDEMKQRAWSYIESVSALSGKSIKGVNRWKKKEGGRGYKKKEKG
jgi:hypothetical protein